MATTTGWPNLSIWPVSIRRCARRENLLPFKNTLHFQKEKDRALFTAHL